MDVEYDYGESLMRKFNFEVVKKGIDINLDELTRVGNFLF